MIHHSMKRSTLMLSLLTILPAYGSIEFLGQWILDTQAGKTEIVVIGDHHLTKSNDSHESDDRVHEKLFMELLEKWKTQKILFLLEASESNHEAVKNDQKELRKEREVNLDFISNLGEFSLKQKKKFGEIDFKWADYRADSIHQFLDFVLVSQGVPNWMLLGVFQKMMKTRSLKKVSELLDDIKDSMDSLDLFQKRYKPDSPVSVLLQAHKNAIADSYQRCKKVFVKTDKDLKADCAHAYLKALATEGEILDGMANALIYDIADVGYIMELEKNKNRYNKIVLFVGRAHTGPVHKYLECIGAKPLNIIGSYDIFTPTRLDTNQVFKTLNDCFKSDVQNSEKSSDALQSIGIHLDKAVDSKNNEKNAHLCKRCNKQCETMKRCGACKTAKYCSAECQKADWQSHKLVCKK